MENNFYRDNESLKFHLNHPLMKKCVDLKENNYADKGKYDYAPADFEDALDSYDRVLEIVGEICGNIIAPNAEEVDAVGPKIVNNEVVSDEQSRDMAREIAAMAARQAGKNISAINTLGGMEVIFPELAEMAKEADEFRRAHILNGVKEALAVHGIQCSPLQEKVLTDIFWAFTDTKLYYMLVSQSGWPEERYEFLLRKVLETVMREVAPEMLKAMRT